MLVGVISDTHDEYEATRCAVDIVTERGGDALFHCGDITTRRVVEICSALPFYFVFGNHDADTVPELETAASNNGCFCLGWGGVVTLGGKQIGITHGHLTMDLQPILEASPDYLFTGHTHEKSLSWHGQTRRVCPGALFRTKTPSVALVNIDDGKVDFINT